METTAKKRRLFFIDNIRILLTILVVMVHIGVAYGSGGRWYYNERNSDMASTAIIGLFLSVCAAFFMGLFFTISGYFTPGSYERKGPWKFIKDRLLRLGVPFLAFVLLFNPILWTSYINFTHFSSIKAVYLGYFFNNPQLYSGIVTGPVWFLLILLIFAWIYLFRSLFVKRSLHPRIIGAPGNRSFIIYALLLSFTTYLVRIKWPMNQWLQWGIINNFFEPAHCIQYISLFLVGIAAYRFGWFEQWPAKLGKTWLIVSGVSILLWPVMMWVGGALSGNSSLFFGGSSWQAMAYAIWESFLCVGLCAGLIIGFRQFLNQQNKLLSSMSAGAFTVYLVHAPIITAMQRYLGGASLHPLAKFGLLTVIGIPLCFLLAEVVRRLPLVNKVL